MGKEWLGLNGLHKEQELAGTVWLKTVCWKIEWALRRVERKAIKWKKWDRTK
jgi:hypothetical protein